MRAVEAIDVLDPSDDLIAQVARWNKLDRKLNRLLNADIAGDGPSLVLASSNTIDDTKPFSGEGRRDSRVGSGHAGYDLGWALAHAGMTQMKPSGPSLSAWN